MLKFQIVFGVCIKYPIFFFFFFFFFLGGGGGGYPFRSDIWGEGYRANARAEPMCQEKLYYPPPPPIGCTPPILCTFDKYFLIFTSVEL